VKEAIQPTLIPCATCSLLALLRVRVKQQKVIDLGLKQLVLEAARKKRWGETLSGLVLRVVLNWRVSIFRERNTAIALLCSIGIVNVLKTT